MRALVVLHRWLGVVFCLFFAMWFASGIVMHFVPFPALTDEQRTAAMVPLDLAGVAHSPAEAVSAAGIAAVTRVRLIERPDGAIYLVSGPLVLKAFRAADLTDAAVRSDQLALAIAREHARLRGLDAAHARVAELASYDQWTVAGNFDRYRPLYRIALNDESGTELYVAAPTGEVVQETTRRERAWNWIGSVAHWIYPLALRRHPSLWSGLVWWLSLAALIGASAGVAVGVSTIERRGGRLKLPHRGLLMWHHAFGLICMAFVWTWIFSGWLSMDDGLLFSTGKASPLEAGRIVGTPRWDGLPVEELQHVVAPVSEVEWFAFGGRIYRRERVNGVSRLSIADAMPGEPHASRPFLQADEVAAAISHLGVRCEPPAIVGPADDYAVSAAAAAPVFRSVCGDDWFDIGGANGALIEKLDSSRRVYRWLFSALHTFDFPVLAVHQRLRAVIVVGLCGLGLVFSLTGVAIGWRRLLLSLSGSGDPQ